jgi:hypothetical protein
MNDMNERETKIEREVNRGLRNLKLEDDSYISGNGIKFHDNNFGVCNDCKHLYAAKTEYGTSIGKCFEMNILLRGIDNISECTMYSKKGSMSLDDMKEIAIIIDVNKNRVGFM